MDIVPVIKSRMRWVRNVARTGEGRVVYRVLVGKPWGKNHWGDPAIDGRVILRWILRKCDVGGMDWIELANYRDKWRALVNVAMNLRVP